MGMKQVAKEVEKTKRKKEGQNRKQNERLVVVSRGITKVNIKGTTHGKGGVEVMKLFKDNEVNALQTECILVKGRETKEPVMRLQELNPIVTILTS